jgi:phosphoribosyl 1,2-cyclic phosphodiesterase
MAQGKGRAAFPSSKRYGVAATMTIRFWGVRGSIPAPINPVQLMSRLAAVIQRIEVKDIASQRSREDFLANLPSHLFSTIGGNTSCVEILGDPKKVIILDAGSGIRELGLSIAKRRVKPEEIHIFFSHFHHDHIQGLPFFTPLFDDSLDIHFYSPIPAIQQILSGQMQAPYFPISLEDTRAKLHFHRLHGDFMQLGPFRFSWRLMEHPGGCYSFKISSNGKSCIYSTDTALSDDDFKKSLENSRYFEESDLIIIDSQYTLDEAIEKYDWGHSSYSLAIDFANIWNIKKVALFHHEPRYPDKKIFSMHESAIAYMKHMKQHDIDIILARESLEIVL